MKYKIIGIVSLLSALVIVTVTLYINNFEENSRYHQHLEATPCEECNHTEDIFCTHLPLVQINTGGVEIPGKAITDTDGKIIGYTTTESGESKITADITIIDNSGTNNHITDTPAISTKSVINVRGNSSRTFDKSGYAIRLVTDAGDNNPQAVMGMDAHHEWALHGPFLDKTLIRNYLCYNLAGEIMEYAPNVRFCEVIINGEYNGVYLMVETITAGENGTRLNISVDKKDNSFTGYAVRLDRGSDTEIKNIDTFSVYSYRTQNQINIEYPGTSNITEQMAESIRQDFSYFEKVLYSYDYDNAEYGYRNLIDVDSFVDYFLINEFTCNYDAGWLSTYVYKDLDGKFKMCVWDFNSALDAYQDSYIAPNRFDMNNCLWFKMLTKDEYFVEKIISRYKELRKTYFSEEYIMNYVDETVAYLGDAIERNYEKWGYSFLEEYDLLKPTDRNPRNYEQAVEHLKEYVKIRGSWLDENIESLRQYCAGSANKKFDDAAN